MTRKRVHNIWAELDAMVEDGRLGALAKWLAREAGVTGDVDDTWYQRALDHVRKYWVSGETITDEQILELRASAPPGSDVARDCNWALASYVPYKTKREALIHCAAAWNTKHGVGK